MFAGLEKRSLFHLIPKRIKNTCYPLQMWSVEYVQVPDETQQKSSDTLNTKDTVTQAASKLTKETSQPIEIVKRRRSSCNSYSEDIQTAVDRLKDFKDPDYMASKQVELGSSVDSNSIFMSTLQETIEGCEKDRSDRTTGVDREDSNISPTSSISDLCNPDEVGIQDNELNQDGEVQSQKSEVSIASAMDALDMAEAVPSEKPSGLSEPVTLDIDKAKTEGGNGTSENDNEGKSPSSEFEVISEAEIKTTTSQTAEDVVKKYRRKTKNTLREGKSSN